MDRDLEDLTPSLFRHAFEASGDALLIIGATQDSQLILYANAAFGRLTGYGVKEALGRDWRFLCTQDGAPSAVADPGRNSRIDSYRRQTFRARREDGREIWLDMTFSALPGSSGPTSLYVAALNDVTAARLERERLEHCAYHDALTGLPNRHLLEDRFERAIARARRDGTTFTLALIDLDGFKFINDSFGHEIGDELLRQIGARLARTVRAGDTAARLGGDEFVLLLHQMHTGDSAHHVAHRIIEVLERPVSIRGHEFAVSCSMGMTHFPTDGLGLRTLLRDADQAMYRVKQSRGRASGGRTYAAAHLRM